MGIEKDGYLPPRDVIFDEIIGKCNSTWLILADSTNEEYIKEKISFNNYLTNAGADVMFAINLFHPHLRFQVIRGLSAEAKDFINYYDQVNENKESSSTRDN